MPPFFYGRSVVTVPYKPMKPCAHPGCPNLTHNRYCEVHQRQADRDYDRYQRSKESFRKYHSGTWAKLRCMKLQRQPLCELCMKEHRYIQATLVHHILPLTEGGTNASDNLMSLCGPCHSRLHAGRGDRWHNHFGAGGHDSRKEEK